MAMILLPPKIVAASLVVATELTEKNVRIRSMRIFIVAPLVRLTEVYAEYAEESTGETHGLDSTW
jgi:hypothetical protein